MRNILQSLDLRGSPPVQGLTSLAMDCRPFGAENRTISESALSHVAFEQASTRAPEGRGLVTSRWSSTWRSSSVPSPMGNT